MRGAGGGVVGGPETSAAQFYLRPRYSVRAEGDAVRDQDRVIFESCRFKGLQLCLERERQHHHAAAAAAAGTGVSFAGGGLVGDEVEGIVGVGDDAYLRSGWQIHLVSRARPTLGLGRDHLLLSSAHLLAGGRSLPAGAMTAAAAAAMAAGKAAGSAAGVAGGEGLSALEEGVVICGGDFVRFAHQEIIGHLIARVDDGAERCSRISPLGMVYRKLQLDRERATGVFLRRGGSQPSALSIFQVCVGVGWDPNKDKSQCTVQIRAQRTQSAASPNPNQPTKNRSSPTRSRRGSPSSGTPPCGSATC
jgi:hypothetical protein